MAYDALLYITGTASNPVINVTTSNSTTPGVTGLATQVVYHADLRVAGTVGGTTPSLTMAINESTSQTTNFTPVAQFNAVTTSMSTGNGIGSAVQTVTFRVTKPYVQWSSTCSGTSPTFGSVSIRVRPTGEAAGPAFSSTRE